MYHSMTRLFLFICFCFFFSSSSSNVCVPHWKPGTLPFNQTLHSKLRCTHSIKHYIQNPFYILQHLTTRNKLFNGTQKYSCIFIFIGLEKKSAHTNAHIQHRPKEWKESEFFGWLVNNCSTGIYNRNRFTSCSNRNTHSLYISAKNENKQTHNQLHPLVLMSLTLLKQQHK